MHDYIRQSRKMIPRIPFEGSIDLTYRCNNNCRHCWVVAPDMAEVRTKELDTEAWIDIIDQARAMGTRRWSISGGEPMLRDDFAEIYRYIAKKASYSSVNTNGTLVTPSIARLFTGNCDVLVSLYGATAEVHDHITRNPGSYTATQR